MNYLIKLLIVLIMCVSTAQAQKIRVGAKHFNEGYLLAEILAQLFENNGFQVERNFNLGGTLICFQGLVNNEIDIYPEYTGTIAQQIIKANRKLGLVELRLQVKQKYNLELSQPYGFNNTYALAMKRDIAKQFNLNKISQLVNFPHLKFAFSYEFLKREDGWESLARYYQLPQNPVGIEHGLSYQALEQGAVDLIDVYSTDGEIVRYDLRLLQDDLEFFPNYYALSFFRPELSSKAKKVISSLSGIINEFEMQMMNARVVFDKRSHAEIAREFLLGNNLLVNNEPIIQPTLFQDILNKTATHLIITFIALIAAILIAIPLGIFLYNNSDIAKPVLYFAGLLQTIPSIALLAFMIPLFGIGVVPAIVALFLYALLPILRNTATALFSIDPLLKNVATGIGLKKWQRLRYVEVPLSIPTIFAGIKTAAVINIGTATLAAFIGAGGLGEFIVTGLALNDVSIILQGAIPAALLAIIVEFGFEMLEGLFVPKHLQQKLGK